MFKWLRNQAEKRRNARNLFTLAANQARNPLFFREFQVSDSMTGRYEILCLHIYLLLERLKKSDKEDEFGQLLTEILVKELERAYRDVGFRDILIPAHIKKLVAGFYERAHSYKAGSKAGNEKILAQSIAHYVYASNESQDQRAVQLASYTKDVHHHLALIPINQFKAAAFNFPAIEIFLKTP